MEQVSRIWFTPRQRAELWERWRSGQCVADIARALGRRNKSGVYRLLALDGGIAPNVRRARAGRPPRTGARGSAKGQEGQIARIPEMNDNKVLG
jgi:hypothetical protein